MLFVGAATVRNLIGTQTNISDTGVLTSPKLNAADSAAELSALMGFNVSDIPSNAEAAESTKYTVHGQFAEIEYGLREQTVTFRKAMGSGDISGDYNNYNCVKTVIVNDMEVTCKNR